MAVLWQKKGTEPARRVRRRMGILAVLSLLGTAVVSSDPGAAEAAPPALDASGGFQTSAQAPTGTSAANALISADFISGANKVFGDGAKFFEVASGSKALAPYAAGFALASDFLTLFGFGKAPSGPTVRDVLNKLDSMSQQLNAIQTQLTAIQSQLSALAATIAAIFQEIHAASCTNQHAQLNQPIAAITSVFDQFQKTILPREATLPNATDPTKAVDTLDTEFSEFAKDTMGEGFNLLPSSWPMAQKIREIHTALMGSGPQRDGLIRTCGQVAVDNFLNSIKSNPKAGWLDDQGYYQDIDDEVRWSQDYEVEALAVIEEAGYFRAAQLYEKDYPNEPLNPADPGAVCRLALEKHPDGLAAALCTNIASELKDTRADMAAEWQLAGVPYSDGRVVLSLPSVSRGKTGNVQAELWIREPSALSDGKGYSTFSDTPPTLSSFDGYRGWRIATTEDWMQLYDALKDSGSSANVLNSMNTSGAFRGILPATFTELESAHPPAGAPWALARSYYWIPGATKEYDSSTGRVTKRCFVGAGIGAPSGGIACSPALATSYFAPGQPLGAALSSISVVVGGVPAPYDIKPLTTWTPKEPIEWVMPVPATRDCLDIFGLPRRCGENFTAWLNNAVPDPTQPSPAPTGQPTMAQSGAATSCEAKGWSQGTAGTGTVQSLPTTWSAQWPTPNASGATTRTVDLPADQALNDTTFATGSGFSPTQPFRVMCTVNGRWSELANSGSARSALYQVTPNRTTPVLTRAPEAPTITAASGSAGSAKVDFHLGETYGSTVTGYTVTPYLNGSALPPVLVPVDPSQPSPAPGSSASITVPAQSGTYRYSVGVDVSAAGTTTMVPGGASNLSGPVTVT